MENVKWGSGPTRVDAPKNRSRDDLNWILIGGMVNRPRSHGLGRDPAVVVGKGEGGEKRKRTQRKASDTGGGDTREPELLPLRRTIASRASAQSAEDTSRKGGRSEKKATELHT